MCVCVCIPPNILGHDVSPNNVPNPRAHLVVDKEGTWKCCKCGGGGISLYQC